MADPIKDVSKSSGIELNGVIYFPLPEANVIDPCTGVGEGQPCPGEPSGSCVCLGGHKHYTEAFLRAKGIKVTP